MTDLIKELWKQPYWVITLLLGVILVIFPTITIDKSYILTTHPPTTLLPIIIGIIMVIFSLTIFSWNQFRRQEHDEAFAGTGLDLTRVKRDGDALLTNVGGCEIRVVYGRIEEHAYKDSQAIILPCNEYFDDRCVDDTRSALGAYVKQIFEGQADAFASLIKHECKRKFGDGVEQQKTDLERAESFGAGQCLLLLRPLNNSTPVALVSTTTQRAGQGLAARISYLFEGMRNLASRLADARINEIAMPLLGAGHGAIDPPLALVGLLLAIAETARYGNDGQRLKKVTIIVYRKDANDPGQVNQIVVRRALALIGARG